MRHSSSTINLGKVMWATLLACCLQASVVVVADDSKNIQSGDDNLQDEGTGKDRQQGWGDLGPTWGYKKRSVPTLDDQLSYYPPIAEKRAWQSLQGGWGKRFSPSENDLTIQELASIIENRNNHNILPINPEDLEIHDDEKRNWNKFSDGWGKRSKWEQFRGSWGKRDPAWSNLKGIWGKRSVQEQFAN